MSVFKRNSIFAGRYLLVELVGEGGFSEVWKAQDKMADNAIVAIKIYAPEKGLDDYGIRQFRQEYAITNPLSHPHLMKVYYFDIADGSPYLIMPYYQLGSLARYLREQGVFTERQVAFLMCQMGSALAELHQQQPPVLHQDIKPDNILIQKPDQYILTDFGISSNTRNTLSKSTTKLKPLTIGYSPPERFDRRPFYHAAGDVFSLGVTLYEMCTNQLPWDGIGGQSLLKGAQIPALPPQYPQQLSRMIESCMAQDCASRPSPEQIMDWGKFYLEQGYWQYEDDLVSPTGIVDQLISRLKKYRVPALAFGVLLLVAGSFLINSKNLLPDLERQATVEPGKQPKQDLNETTFVSVASVEKVAEKKESTPGNTDIKIPPDNKTKPGNSGKKESVLTNPTETQNTDNGPKDSSLKNYKESHPPISKAGLNDKKYPDNKKVVPDKKSNIKTISLNSYTRQSLEDYLNQISDPKIASKKKRKEMKALALKLFASEDAQVIDEKDGLGSNYQAGLLLDLLVDIPHKVKVMNGIEKDEHGRITRLNIQLDSI